MRLTSDGVEIHLLNITSIPIVNTCLPSWDLMNSKLEASDLCFSSYNNL